MGIGGIATANGSMSFMQTTSAAGKDQKSKSIQAKITDVQQQIQKLSSDEELSANEKAGERQKLLKEKSSLDAKLKQHQEALLRSQKREIRLAKLLEERNPETVIAQNSDGTVLLKEVMNPSDDTDAVTENEPVDETIKEPVPEKEPDSTAADPTADAKPSAEKVQGMVSAASSMQLAARQGTLVAKTADGIAILKGEIKQDEFHGMDTKRKQETLKEMQRQRQLEMAFQFSMLGEADNAMGSAAETNASGKNTQAGPERTFRVSGLNTAQEEQALRQGMHVSIA